MPGLTLEQLQKMGAKPKQQVGRLDVVQPNQPNFSQRIGEDLARRRETMTAGLEAQSRGQQTPLESGIQAVGQGAGLVFDVAGEALKSVIDTLPDAIKKPIKDVAKSVLDTPIGQAGIRAISQGVDAYKSWKAGNPRAARDLESVVNIGMLLPVGTGTKIVGKEALSITGEAAGKVATKLEGSLAKQSLNETLDIIKPVLSKTEKEQALEAGRGVVENRILPRKYEKITLVPTQKEKEIANVVNGIVSKSKSPIDNIGAIQDEIAKTAESVKTGLENSNIIFNKNQIKSTLNKAKDESRVVFGSDKSLQNSYSSVVDEMMRQIDNQPKNLNGLLQARKNFDQIINLKFPKLLSNSLGDATKQNAVRDVRKAVNQFIADQLPEGNSFKSELRRQNLMYDAIENISKKTASAVDASAVQKVMRALRQNPLVAGVTGGILTYGALMGMFSNPVVIGTIALGGTFKLGKAVITSRILRESLISVLRGLEKAGKMADGTAIRDFLKRLSNNTSVGLSIKDVSKSIPKELQPLVEDLKGERGVNVIDNRLKENPRLKTLLDREVQKGNIIKIKDDYPFYKGTYRLASPEIAPNIPKELEPLAEEARKYKSAEEFVKAQTKSTGWSDLQKKNPDLFNTGILRKSQAPYKAIGEIPIDVHSAQSKWQNYGQYSEIEAGKIYDKTDNYGYYLDKEGNTIRDVNGNALQNNTKFGGEDAMVSNEQLKNSLIDSFKTPQGKKYLTDVIDALPKNPDGSITAYRIGNIGGEGAQSYTLSEGMAKTFSNQGTDILPAGVPGLPRGGYKDFGVLPVNIVKVDPKGIVAWNPYDSEILVEPKYVQTKSQLTDFYNQATKGIKK